LKQVLVIILLAAIFGGLVFINRALAGKHYVVSGSPGELLYAESFDNPAAWGQYDDGQLAAQSVDGVMQVSVNSPNAGAFSSATPYFGTIDFSATATAVEGPVDNGFGVIFGLQSQDNQRVGDDSYFLFLVSSDGYYRVTRTEAGQERIISNWIQSDVVNSGLDERNSLRVVAQDGVLRFYVNDQPVQLCVPDDPAGISTYLPSLGCVDGQMLDSLVDSTYTDGQIGVVAQSTATGGPGVVVDFDNVVVLAPGAQP
jgi:hypothetical protein